MAASLKTKTHNLLKKRVFSQWQVELIKINSIAERVMEYTKILVVDDDKNMTLLLSEILKDLGHEVAIAHSAEEAMELIESEDFYIVISDLQLPGMSGIDLLRFIKGFNNLIQVFIMSAHSNKQRVIACLKAGATDYFEKPFNTEDVIISMQATIHRVHKWAQLVMNSE